MIYNKNNVRLDVAISELFNISRSHALNCIKNGFVSLNGINVIKPSLIVKANDNLILNELIEDKKIDTPEVQIPITYVYKDDDIAIINKPRGLVVHPSCGHKNDSLVNQIYFENNFKDKFDDENNIRPGIVHRIDKDTSGLLAVALNEKSFEVLQQEVQNKDFERTYLALVYGKPTDDKFKVNVPLTKPNHTIRKAMPSEQGKRAITHFETITRSKEVSLLKCNLETGRTHQIRAHLAYMNLPVVGDSLYGKRDDKIANEGQALHAYKLSIIHPITLQRMTFFAPLDDYFKKLLIHFYKK